MSYGFGGKNMKLRYIITKYVDATSVEEALRLAKRTPIHECYLLSQWWEKNGYQLNKSPKPLGFADKKLTQQK